MSWRKYASFASSDSAGVDRSVVRRTDEGECDCETPSSWMAVGEEGAALPLPLRLAEIVYSCPICPSGAAVTISFPSTIALRSRSCFISPRNWLFTNLGFLSWSTDCISDPAVRANKSASAGDSGVASARDSGPVVDSTEVCPCSRGGNVSFLSTQCQDILGPEKTL